MKRRTFLAAIAAAGSLETGDAAPLPGPDCTSLWTKTMQPGCSVFNPDGCFPPSGTPNPITMKDFGCHRPNEEPHPWIDFSPKMRRSRRRRLWSQIDPKNDAKFLRDLKTGYCRMNALDQTDKRSLIFQMWLHEFYCDSWPPGSIHRTWAFLPWHRAFLYFHERILADLSGNPDLRLPVWDWEDPKSRWVPDFYRDLGLPKFLQGNWGRYDKDRTNGQWLQICAMQAWLFGNFQRFHGSPPCRQDPCETGPACDSLVAGWSSNGPHILGHSIVGGAMANIPTAAADPLFYSHHANVDRYWMWWQKNSAQYPPPQSFLDQYFFLYDEQQRLVRVRASQVMHEEALGYSYSDPASPWCDLEPVDLKTNPARTLTTLMVGSLAATSSGIAETPALVERIATRSLQLDLNDVLQNSCLQSIPVQIRGTIKSGTPQPGMYYLAALHGSLMGDFRIGGFGIFPGAHHHEVPMTVAITGCIDPDVWNRLLHWKGDRSLIWGAPVSDGSIIQPHAGGLWEIEISDFDLLVPPQILDKGTAWLKDQEPLLRRLAPWLI